MGKHILFVVHGIGVHPAQATPGTPVWSEEIRTKLRACADSARYPFFATHDLGPIAEIEGNLLRFDAERHVFTRLGPGKPR